MDLQAFAETYRVATRRDVDGTDIIGGKLGHIYEHSDRQLALLFMPAEPRARLWGLVKAKGIAAGMTLRQNADSEGTLLFDGGSPEQARLAINLVKARTKRFLTEEQRSALAERLSKIRQVPLKNGTSASTNVQSGAV